ncbi:hypothetical protein OG887_43655 (plasmid) [Streptomyces sp. NBC_00053]|uniref:hypothetical protein n=1 Tax=unclassified Streptomyces TaxID=2593676 RepID=UPI00224DE20D|nr:MULTISPECIES: hypothetical protein [unclassified Streptomyces]MCX4400157.1 hypothetical protein [Streptomyces sp. NBC_01767]MCX5106824.1 hypothetical protein [Streptomyces sp. NBC_00439]MCX5506204.1 hypothetical protein [Streptomyces sp. NBC_00052]MCX5554093.1 hypothetical protein [Streptomyces sp. NBC_00051]
MPTVFQQLAAHREISALRNVLDCSLDASVLREGAGTGPAWLMFLCPAYSEELPGWPAAATHTDNGSMSCGTVLDYRSMCQNPVFDSASVLARPASLCC